MVFFQPASPEKHLQTSIPMALHVPQTHGQTARGQDHVSNCWRNRSDPQEPADGQGCGYGTAGTALSPVGRASSVPATFPRPGRAHRPAHARTRYQRRTSVSERVDVHALTCMCTLHAWRALAWPPTGPGRTPSAGGSGGRCPCPRSLRKGDTDSDKCTEITGPASGRETGPSAALRSGRCRSSAPRARGGPSQRQSPPGTHPPGSPAQALPGVPPASPPPKNHHTFASRAQQKQKSELTPKRRARTK